MTVAENAAAIEALVARVSRLEVLQNPAQLVSQLQADLDSYKAIVLELTTRIQAMESSSGDLRVLTKRVQELEDGKNTDN